MILSPSQNMVYVPDYRQVMYHRGQPDIFLKSLHDSNAHYFLSVKGEATRIVFDDCLHVFVRKATTFDPHSIYLFRQVKDKALEYINRNEVILPPPYPVNYTNDRFTHGKPLISTDINNAYWRIALNRGIIDEETYEKGVQYKTTCLASLAVLGKETVYQEYWGAQLVNKCAVKGNKKLQALYTSIRYECYNYMNEVRETLADDFYRWKTDEVIYVKEDENIKVVHEILRSKNLTFKDKIPVL